MIFDKKCAEEQQLYSNEELLKRVLSTIDQFADKHLVERYQHIASLTFYTVPTIFQETNLRSLLRSVLSGNTEARRWFRALLQTSESMQWNFDATCAPETDQHLVTDCNHTQFIVPNLPSPIINTYNYALLQLACEVTFSDRSESLRFFSSLKNSLHDIAQLDYCARKAQSTQNPYELLMFLDGQSRKPINAQWDSRTLATSGDRFDPIVNPGGTNGGFVFDPRLPDPWGGLPRDVPIGFPGGEDDGPGFDPSLPEPGPSGEEEEHDCLDGLSEALQEIGPLSNYVTTIESIEPPNACTNHEMVLHGDGFDKISNNLQVHFRSEDSGQVTAIPTLVTPTEIHLKVPDGATCGNIEIKLGTPVIISACGTSTIFDLTTEGDVHFNGGRTRIRAALIDSPASCIHGGDIVQFVVNVCNVSALHLTMSGPFGTVDLGSFPSRAVRNEIPVTIPRVNSDTRLSLQIDALGPCGSDSAELSFPVASAEEFPSEVNFVSLAFRNWNENIMRDVQQFAPDSLEELISAIKKVDEEELEDGRSRRIGIAGSSFSFSDCVLPEFGENYYLIDTVRLDRLLPRTPADSVLNLAGLTDPVSVIPALARRQYGAVIDSISNTRDRLVMVEAGVKLKTLTRYLREVGMTLPTIGGGNAQSLMGVMSTGSHGSTSHLPPITDFVRAIHLVAAGGEQWWIESRASPITNSEQMQMLRGDVLPACINISYDDNLFNAVLTAFGSAGVVYSLVYEVIDDHRMRRITYGGSWSDAIEFIDTRILTPAEPLDWWAELLVYPDSPGQWDVRISTANLTTDPLTPCVEEESPTAASELMDKLLNVFGLGFLLSLAPLAPVSLAPLAPALAGAAIATSTAILTVLFTPFIIREAALITYYFLRFNRAGVRRASRVLRAIRQGIGSVIGIVRGLLRGDESEEVLNDHLPNLINALYFTGPTVSISRQVINLVQEIITLGDRPTRDDVLVSDLALRSEPVPHCAPEDVEGEPEDVEGEPEDVEKPTPWGEPISPGFKRLVESHEYVLPVSSVVRFVERLCALADEIRGGVLDGDALIVTFPIRFTQPSRALLAMQRPGYISAHVELFVMERLDGADEFIRRSREIAAEFNAIPHWGQLHDENRDFEEIYGSNLSSWRRQITSLHNQTSGSRQLFENNFCTSRNLLP